jgi:hypothetical protein
VVEERAPGATVEPGADRPLVLDELSHQLEQFRILRSGTDAAATDQLLDKLGAQDPVEHQMVLELSATRPLGHPERFAEAHSLALRALEVLDRNGARAPRIPRIGPLTPIAAFGVQLVTRFIVRNHQADVIDALRNLYARRLAWCAPGDAERLPLLRARNDAERVAAGYNGNPIGVPTGASWCILRGAAIARHRIKLTVEEPLAALWETIGRCGGPPEDDAQMFAVYAIILTIVGWLVIPAGVFFVFAAF